MHEARRGGCRARNSTERQKKENERVFNSATMPVKSSEKAFPRNVLATFVFTFYSPPFSFAVEFTSLTRDSNRERLSFANRLDRSAVPALPYRTLALNPFQCDRSNEIRSWLVSPSRRVLRVRRKRLSSSTG